MAGLSLTFANGSTVEVPVNGVSYIGVRVVSSVASTYTIQGWLGVSSAATNVPDSNGLYTLSVDSVYLVDVSKFDNLKLTLDTADTTATVKHTLIE